MHGGFALPPFTFMLSQVKLSGSGSCLTPSDGVYSSIMAESNDALANVPGIPGSLGESRGDMFYAGESLHRRADLYGVRSTEDECYLLLSPSSKEPSFSWVLALVMVLGDASSPSCITFTIHTPVQL